MVDVVDAGPKRNLLIAAKNNPMLIILFSFLFPYSTHLSSSQAKQWAKGKIKIT